MAAYIRLVQRLGWYAPLRRAAALTPWRLGRVVRSLLTKRRANGRLTLNYVAAEHLYMFRRVKEGSLVGVDALGNKYWENKTLPHGQDRWWEPPQFEAQQLQDASAVTPEWHGWLHHVTDVVPKSSAPLRTGPAIVQHSDAPGNHHVPESVRAAQWRPNPTLVRERGYGIGTYYSKPGENGFYTQPGSPASPLHQQHIPEIVKKRWMPPTSSTAPSADDAVVKGEAEPWTQLTGVTTNPGADMKLAHAPKQHSATATKWAQLAAQRAKMDA